MRQLTHPQANHVVGYANESKKEIKKTDHWAALERVHNAMPHIA